MNVEDLKRQAAVYAVDTFVEDDMRLGLGTGSTMAYALRQLGEYIKTGRLNGIVGVPTSERTAKVARSLGIPLTTLEETPELDLCIDGADEVDPSIDLIKGLGGALLREKIVALASRQMVVIVDETKRVERLGSQSPVPVEVLEFGWSLHEHWLAGFGCETSLRRAPNGSPYVTDSGNYIYDCTFPNGLENPPELEANINNRPGIVENGLFLGYADHVVVATADQGVQMRSRQTE